MKKIINEKTKQKVTVFNTYELKGQTSCPECKQPLTEYDFKLIDEIGKRSCIKCGAILKK